MSKIVKKLNSTSESFEHKAIKQLFYKYFQKFNSNIKNISLEKYIYSRRADIYIKLKNGKEIVVEIQKSNISIKEINKRTRDYNERGIYILWILYGKGQVVGSPKSPKNEKNLKISSAEKYLHTIYGGRVYYVNINIKNNDLKITLPYALHFSLSDKYKSTPYKANFRTYFIRDTYYSKIPSWNLLCIKFNDYRIARFFDRNVKINLQNQLIDFISKSLNNKLIDFNKSNITKRIIKNIYN
ncbi:MAG: competence protein CoiA family protein, partial [Promethearchaeota archaeon]